MNTPNKPDFFPEISKRDAPFVAPDIYEPYQETEEDFLHEKRLRELEAEINEKLGLAATDDELGELPYDADADRVRWDELGKDFDRVFDEAKKH